MSTPIQHTGIGRMMGELEKGKFLVQVEERLEELGRELADLGGRGALTIRINMEAEVGRSATATLTGEVTIKKPRRKPKPLVRFLTPAGEFVNEDPEQPDLFPAENVVTIGSDEEAPKRRNVK